MPNIWSRICPQGHFWLKDQINRAHKSREREKEKGRGADGVALWIYGGAWPYLTRDPGSILSATALVQWMSTQGAAHSTWLVVRCVFVFTCFLWNRLFPATLPVCLTQEVKEAVLCGLRAVKNLLTSAKLTRHLNSIVEDVTRLQLYEKVVWEHADLTCQCSSPEVKMIIGPINACVQPSYCTDWRVFFFPTPPSSCCRVASWW